MRPKKKKKPVSKRKTKHQQKSMKSVRLMGVGVYGERFLEEMK